MATKKRGLGRGLDALLGNANTQVTETVSEPAGAEDSGTVD